MKVELPKIRTDGGTQPRAGIDQTVVAEYAEAIEAGDAFPPLTVFHDGTTYWLADGFHRYASYRQLETLEVEADVRQGERRDAVLFSVGANATHGLRRTNEDKRRAVQVLLEDGEWSQWSDREIARRAGVHHDTVGKLRAEFTGGFRQSDIRKGADGRAINTANIGKSQPEAPKSSDLSEFTRERYSKTYSPPVTPDEPEEDDRPELIAPPRKMNFETGEGIVNPDASPEFLEIANQPVPPETPDTRMRQALKREGYDEAEKVGKLMTGLLNYDEGKLMEIVNSASGRLLGLPRFYKLLLKELERDERTLTA